jgi:hypothetical protein
LCPSARMLVHLSDHSAKSYPTTLQRYTRGVDKGFKTLAKLASSSIFSLAKSASNWPKTYLNLNCCHCAIRRLILIERCAAQNLKRKNYSLPTPALASQVKPIRLGWTYPGTSPCRHSRIERVSERGKNPCQTGNSTHIWRVGEFLSAPLAILTLTSPAGP